MAANEYYNAGHNQFDTHPPPSYVSSPTHHASEAKPTLPPLATGANVPPPSPYDHTTPYDSPAANPYDPNHRASQYTLASEPDERAHGRTSANDHYAEDIPLKNNAAQQEQWMNQNTHYPPTPESQRAGVEDFSRRDRGGKVKFAKMQIAWVTYLLTAVQVGVFIGELIKSAQLTGSPIEIHPTFNPMIGPSPYVQINMGARFIPCMKSIPGLQNSSTEISWQCPNATTTAADCTLSELCGMSGVPNPQVGKSLEDQPQPNQWYRFIVPIFLHGGLIHIGFNMLAQVFLGKELEKTIGWWRFLILYFASGIFGFVLGGNFAGNGVASTGASGSLFGIIAIALLDLLYTWKQRPYPGRELVANLICIVISFVLGLLPGLDNFAHIGGFLMGLVLGVCILRSPNALRERIGLERQPYVAMSGGAGPGNRTSKVFAKSPVGFFKGRKPLWWAWWLVRVAALVGVLAAFIVLINNFYKYQQTCSWCVYLSCLPINNWCDSDKLTFTQTNSSNTRRWLLANDGQMFS